MNAMLTVVIVIQVLSALVIIGLVLLQHGKGADMGAAFGSGASGSLFGATGSSNFLSKSTGVATAIFFAATLGLASLGGKHVAASGGGVMDSYTAPPVVAPASLATAPAASATAPASSTAAGTPSPAPNAATPAAPAAPVGQSNQIPK